MARIYRRGIPLRASAVMKMIEINYAFPSLALLEYDVRHGSYFRNPVESQPIGCWEKPRTGNRDSVSSVSTRTFWNIQRAITDTLITRFRLVAKR